LGMQRGELQGRAFGFASITTQHPDWLKEKKVAFLAQAGAKRETLLPDDVPLLTELARNEEQRRIMELISSAPALGQPVSHRPASPWIGWLSCARRFMRPYGTKRFSPMPKGFTSTSIPWTPQKRLR